MNQPAPLTRLPAPRGLITARRHRALKPRLPRRLRLVAVSALLACGLPLSMAQPVGGQIVGGAASITHGANLTQIQQQSQRAIINWKSFGIPAGQTVQFQQPNAQAAILNRVTGALPTHIDGRLSANGQVFLVNPNGIVVGANGVISAQGGFVGSTQSISDAAFMAGAGLSFDGGSDGRMEVLGRIESANGPITLIAPKLSVGASASLKAGSSIQLIAASQVQLSNGKFTVIPKPGDAGELTQSGVLEAAQVQLAAVNQNLGALAINTSGTIRANATQTNPDGSVSIVATGPARVELHDASITATGADGKGGRIDVSGERTGLFGQTVLDASGAAGGGSIRVGGGWQGKEADLPNAQVTYVEEGVKLKADATQAGDGGRVVVWADDTTRYAGDLSARGAGVKADGTQGAGGSAEVSGKGTLQFSGTADLRGANDQAQTGTLLLDPSNITIQSTGPDTAFTTQVVGGTTSYTSGSGDSTLTVGTLQTLLSTANVIVETNGTLAGTGGLGAGAQNDGTAGDIWIKDPLAWSSAKPLYLRAHDDVILDASISASAGGLNINDFTPSGGTVSTHRNVWINQPVTANSISIAGANGVQVAADLTGTSIAIGGGSILPQFGNPGAPWDSGGGVLTFTNNPVITGDSIALFSGKPASGAVDLTTEASFRPTQASNAFSYFQLGGFRNITPDIRTSTGGARSDITVTNGLGLMARERLDLSAYPAISANAIRIAGGATDWQTDINMNVSTGRLVLAPATTITAGTGELWLTSGFAGGTRPDFTDVTLRYGSPTNQFGDINIKGFSNIDLILQDFAGVPVNLLSSSSSVALYADDRLRLQEDVKAKSLVAVGGGNNGVHGSVIRADNSAGWGRVEFSSGPQVLQVGGVYIMSGDGDKGAAIDRPDFTNITLRYPSGNSSNSSFVSVFVQGMNNLTMRMENSSGGFDRAINTTSGIALTGTGLLTVPQDLVGGPISVQNLDSTGSAFSTSSNIGQIVLRDPSDPLYSGPQSVNTTTPQNVVFLSSQSQAARTDFTNVIFGTLGSGTYTGFNVAVRGFNNVLVRRGNSTDQLQFNSFYTDAISGDVVFGNDVTATSSIVVGGRSMNNPGKLIVTPTVNLTFTGTATQPSTLNLDTTSLSVGGVLNGNHTVTINERSSVGVQSFGDPASTADLKINAQGDIAISGTVTRSVGGSGGVYLLADADLSSIFGAGTGGANGLGAVIGNAGTVYSVPVFKAPFIYPGAPFSYSVDAGGTISLTGGAGAGPAAFAALSNGAKISFLASLGLPTGANSTGAVTTNMRGIINGAVGITPVADLQTFFTDAGGRVQMFVSGYTNLGGAALTAPQLSYQWKSSGSGSGSGAAAMTISTPSGDVTLGGTGTWTVGGTTYNVLSGGDTLANLGDVGAASGPGDAAYWGKPLTGASNLNMSGQFYSLSAATVTLPTTVTAATLTPTSSTGWLRYSNTSAVTLAGGSFVASGAVRATDGSYVDMSLGTNLDQGVGIPGNAGSSLRITSNGGSVMLSGYRDIFLRDTTGLSLGAGALSLQAGRDVYLNANPAGGSTTGSVALIAGGAITTAPGVVLGGTGAGSGAVYLQAGQGLSVTTNLAAIEGGLGFAGGDGRYLGRGLTSGLGLNASSFAAMLASSGRNTLSAATAAATSFKVLETDQGNNGLAVGSTTQTYSVWNAATNTIDVLSPVGLTATPDANNAAPINANVAIYQQNAAKDLKVTEAIAFDTTAATALGEINLRSAGDLALNASITSAGGKRNLFLESGGAITQSTGTLTGAAAVLTAGTTIGKSAQLIQTQLAALATSSGGNQFVQEADDLTLAARSTAGGTIDISAGGALSVGSVALTPVAAAPAASGTPGTLTGVTASGSGGIKLTSGAGADVLLGQQVRSGTGSVTVTAGRSIVDAMAGDLASDGSETSASARLNLATGGNMALSAGNSVGSTGTGAPDALEIWVGGTLSSSSAGTTGDAGTYLNLLHTSGASPSILGVNSARTIDVASRASTTSPGKLVTSTITSAGNGGYVRLAADADLQIQDAVMTAGAGAVVLQAGLSGVGNFTQGAAASITSTSGEVNIQAAGQISQGAAITTQGNILAHSGGAMVSTGGVWQSTGAAGVVSLQSGGGVGSTGQRFGAQAAGVAVQSAGDQHVALQGSATEIAATASAGAVDILAGAGAVTVGRVDAVSTLTNTTGSVGTIAPGMGVMQGVSGTGAVSVVALGAASDLTLNRDVVSSAASVSLQSGRDVVFNLNTAQANASGAVTVTAGRDILNATGQGGAAGRDQIKGGSVVLSAGGKIGAGVIDDTLAGTGNVQDLNIDTTQLQATASGGDAVLWTRGAVQLTGASSASGRFGLNAGGAVTQAAGATLSAADVEIDTMRDAATGSVLVRNTGDLTVAGLNNVGGHYTATSQTGKVIVGGTLKVNGDVTLTGTTVQITGTIQQSGNVVQNGIITNAGGVALASVVVSGSVATVNASGAGADAGLSLLLTPAVLAGLPGGVTTVTVNLGNTVNTYSVAALTNAAVTLNNTGNAVTGGWTVRTGKDLGAVTQTQRNWNLTDAGAAVDLGSRALEVNAARGTANAAGSQASSVTAVANAANTAAGFDAVKGSSVMLNQTRTTGSVVVKDANDVQIDTPAAVNLGYVYANGKLDVHSAGDLTVSGAQRAGGAYARLAADGKLDIQNTVTAAGSGNVVLQAGLGGAGDLVQGAAITSGSGEVNVRAAGNITQGAAITTAGNILAQSGGAITSTGGTWSSTGGAVSLRAGSSIGSSGNRVTVQAANVASQSTGDQFVALQGAATQVAASSSAGAIDLQAGAGSLTVGDVNAASGLTAGTGGVGATATGTGGALQGVTASGAVSVAAIGATSDLTLNRDVSSASASTTLGGGRDVSFSLNDAQANAAGAVSVTASRDVLNATGQGGMAGRDQIKGGSVVLSAGGKIGSGAIDDTLAGTGNVQDLNVDTTQLQATASGGDAVLWTRGGVQLSGASSATGRFGLNAGGVVTQAAGATLSAADVEIDTMRDATTGSVTLRNNGDLTVAGLNNVAGNYSATSQTGKVAVTGALRANGDVTLTGTSVQITGTVEQAGNLTQNGVITNAGGAVLAALTVSGSTATVNAYGSAASFDLSQLLTPAVLAGLPAGVTTITVNLGNTINTYSVAALTNAAVTLNNTGNSVTGGWTVRTGQALGVITAAQRNWNLTDSGAAVDLGSRALEVNAARGTANAAGSQASSVTAVANAANTAAGFDAAKGSSVTLSQTRTTGSVVIKDANDVQIDTPAAVNLGYVYANDKLDVHSAGDLTVSGAQRAGGAYARLAADGKLDIQNTVTAAGSGNVVLQAGLGGAGDLVQGAAITSGSGEVNVRAAGNITQGAAITTAGNILAQSGGAITSTGGVWSSTAPAGSVALRAGSTIGSTGNRVTVQAANVASQSAGDQFVALQGAATQVAASSSAGGVDLRAGAGSLTVGDVSVASGLSAGTGGIGATAAGTGGALQGVTAGGAASVAAVGATSDLTLNRDVSSTGSTVAITSGRDVTFSLNNAQANASGTVTVTAGRDILNATGQGGMAGRDQIKGGSVVLSAGGKIGSGVIDDTLAGTSNVQDLNVDTTQLQATASGGDAVLWTRGAVQLTGASSASGRFGLNAGGAVTQAAGATLSAADVEIDTMRDSTTGSVTLRNTGDLTVAGLNHVAGNYTATSQTGKVTVGGTLKVNGDVTLTGTSVQITGTIQQSGNVMQNGIITNAAGAVLAGVVVSGNVATVNASGVAADADLSLLLTPAVLAGLPGGVTTITVNLGNTVNTYSVAALTNTAIALNNTGNNVTGGWTVRTGTGVGAATQTQRSWNLTDAGAAVDLGSRALEVNAARGTANAAGSQASSVAAVANAANTAAGFDATKGSSVTLSQTRTSGVVTVKDANDVQIDTPAAVNLGYVYANGKLDVHSAGAMTVSGTQRAGGTYARLAADGKLDIQNTVTAAGNGNVVLQAGLGGAGDLVQGAAVTSGSGEVNVRAAGNITQGAAITTAGNILAQSGGAITSTGGVWSSTAPAGAVALRAGTTTGSTGNRVTVQAANVASQSAGDQFVALQGAATQVAASSSAGAVDLQAAAGSVTVGGVSIATVLTASTGGVGALANGPGAIQGISANGYARVAAQGTLDIQSTVAAAGSGNVVLQAGLGGSGDLVQDAAITSGSGEVNVRAAGNITQGAAITTAGNILAQSGGAITSTGGVWSSTAPTGSVALRAGTTIGSTGNRVTVQAANVASQSAGDQFVALQGAATQVAASSTAGAADLRAGVGSLTVGDVTVASGLTAGTGGIGATAAGTGGAVQGVTAGGAASVAAVGATSDLTLNRDVSSTGSTVAITSGRDVTFSLNNAQANASGAVTVTAGRDILNATGQGGTAGRDQIKGSSVVLSAGGKIGSGVIDDTLAGTSNVQDLNIDAAQLQATASGGDAVLWTRGGVQLSGASSASGRFGLNAGGVVTQAAGATLSAADVEIDTMRDATTGSVTLRNNGDLTVAGLNNVAGNYSATSQTGKVAVTGALRANGDVTLTGTSVLITGTVEQAGNLTQNGVITNAGGAVLAALTVSGSIATVNAYGSAASFDLSQLLTPAVLAGLPGGVTTITVNLGNTINTYSVAALTNSAITLNNAGNAVTGGWTVRTGQALGAITAAQRNWNLTDAGAAVDLGSRALEVNAARGTANAAGSQASSVTAVANAANTAAGFDATKGSSVTLSQTRTSGVVTVKDANDVVIDTPAAVNLGYVYANGKLDVHSAGAMTVSGAQRAGGAYARLAADGKLDIQNTVTATGSGNVVLQAGLGGSGDLVQDAAITSGSGEVNVRAAGNITQGAAITTAGNILAQSGGAITSTGGVWSSTAPAGAVALRAGSTIGSTGNRVTVQAANVASQSTGDQFVALQGVATQVAASSSAGGVDLRAGAGSLTVGDVSVASGLSAGTGGIGATAAGTGGALQGVTAGGAASVAAVGATSDLTLNRDVSSTGSTVAITSGRDVTFSLNNAQANASGAVTVTAGRDILNATGQGGTAGRDQIQGGSVALSAGGKIGSGVIDDTLAGTSNVQDLNIDAAQLQATASGGDAVLWTRGGVQLSGASSASGRFGLNAGGVVTQAAGATLSAADVEIDTMRDATTGSVTLRNNGDLTVAGLNNVAGNYSATSQTGKVAVTGALRANGDVTLTGTSVQITGTVERAGNLTQNGVITNAGGAVLAALTVSGSTATVNAYGSAASFDLSQLLTPAVLAGLPGGVTTITVNLGNTINTYSVAALTNSAITLNNTGNSVTGGWTVRTGQALGAITAAQRNWNLTDSGAAVDLGSRALEVNAARGTANAAGSQASSVTAVANAANTAAGFDAAKGSSVTLSQTRTSGVVTVKDANDVQIDTPAAVNLGYVYANGKLDVHSAGALTVSDTQRAGGAYARLAADGKLDIQNTITAAGSGNVVLQAGLAGSGDLVQDAAITSGSGEVNVRAAGNITQGAAITTAGNILAQSGGAITSTGGVWSSTAPAGAVALRAGTTIGSTGNRVTVQAANVASQSAGDQFVALQGAATQVAASSSAGGVDLRAGAGSLTVGDVSVASGLTAGTGGIGATAAGTGGALQGVAARDIISVAAVGATSDLTLNRDVSSNGASTTLSAGRDVTFSLNNAQANASGTVTVTAGRDILNATGQGGTAGRDQIKGSSVVLSASGKIGSGVIDDTLAGTSNVQDLNVDTTQLQATASGGDAVLWTRGGVQLTGASSASGRFGLNAGGGVTQGAGATLSASDVEIDTMRDAATGSVLVRNTGDLTVAGLNNVGGHYTATSQTGKVIVGGTLKVNGDVTLTGTSVQITGMVEQAGNLTQNGVITNAGGAVLAALTVSGSTATVNASGAAARVELSQLLTPSVLAGLPAGVTTITVNLGNQVATYSVAALTSMAIDLDNAGNSVTGGWTVRTGAKLGTTVLVQRSYNLTDAAAAVDLGSRSVEINAARGTSFAAGAQASPIAAVSNSANTAAGFDATQGSTIELSQTRTSGNWTVRDAGTVSLSAPAGDLHVAYAHSNGALGLNSAQGDLTTTGAVRAGSHLLAAAARDLVLDLGTTIAAPNGRITLIADQASGTQPGAGRLINRVAGLDIVADSHDDVALYAPWGGAVPAGYSTTVPMDSPRFVPNGLRVNGVAVDPDRPAIYWGSSYLAQFGTDLTPGNGQFGSVRVWYKAPLAQLPTVVALPAPAVASLMWLSQPLPLFYSEKSQSENFALIDCSAQAPEMRKASQLFGRGMMARLSVASISYLPVPDDQAESIATPLKQRLEDAQRRCLLLETRGDRPAPAAETQKPDVPVSAVTRANSGDFTRP